ncbi:MAG TPA: ATP-binding protein [Ktedonobacterales bacterium]|jgi:two-component system sensor histidine kinase KdpD
MAQSLSHRLTHSALWQSLRVWLTESPRSGAPGYLLAPVGVAVATIVIGLTESAARISDVSLLYLPVVLWLAMRYGRGPAILASVLAFFSYDFFFIPPLHLLTVGEPSEWLSLFALLATALALGHLTAVVRARAHEAEESQRRTDILYRLAQLIATATTDQQLYDALTQQIVSVFAPSGVHACALLLPEQTGAHQIIAFAYEQGYDSCPVDAQPGEASGRPTARDQHTIVRTPLKTTRGVVGSLLLSGAPAIRLLAPDTAPATGDTAPATGQEAHAREQAPLFAAFCDQIALAIDRAALASEAMRAAALRESDRLKDSLLGSVTHDLRTPLAAIKAATSSLLQNDVAWDAQERRELLGSIDVSTDRLNHLVGNLLDLSRLEAGVAQPDLDWRLMSDVIASTLDQLELSGQLGRHTVRIEEPDELPLVLMDQEQIQQALTNLIENALKYSPEGSEIRIQTRVVDDELCVAVIDQGIGIPPREITAIFDKFYRVQQARLPWSRKRPPIGTGLGLAICAAIVKAHGGRIWAESEPGHGATLTFTLPLATDRPQGGLPEIAASAETAPPATPATPEAREAAV